jgi:hypothetical protein
MAAIAALDLITDAFYEIGAYGPGDPVPPHDNDLAFRILNRLIAASNTNRANIFTKRIDLWTTQNQKQFYTIGQDPDGVLVPDWNGARPVSIERANLLLPTSPTVRKPIQILDDSQWSEIRLQQINTWPQRLYNDGANPLSSIFLWPIPDGAYQIELYTWQQNAQLQDYTSELIYPPGYEEFWLYNFAVRLCGPFSRPVTPDLREMARSSAAAIQSFNTQSPLLASDPSLRDSSGSLYNWLTGMNE